jgi:hypothetical protein
MNKHYPSYLKEPIDVPFGILSEQDFSRIRKPTNLQEGVQLAEHFSHYNKIPYVRVDFFIVNLAPKWALRNLERI